MIEDYTDNGPVWDPTLAAYYYTYDADTATFAAYDNRYANYFADSEMHTDLLAAHQSIGSTSLANGAMSSIPTLTRDKSTTSTFMLSGGTVADRPDLRTSSSIVQTCVRMMEIYAYCVQP